MRTTVSHRLRVAAPRWLDPAVRPLLTSAAKPPLGPVRHRQDLARLLVPSIGRASILGRSCPPASFRCHQHRGASGRRQPGCSGIAGNPDGGAHHGGGSGGHGGHGPIATLARLLSRRATGRRWLQSYSSAGHSSRSPRLGILSKLTIAVPTASVPRPAFTSTAACAAGPPGASGGTAARSLADDGDAHAGLLHHVPLAAGPERE